MKPVEDFFTSIVSLPSLPKVVQEVIQMLNHDNEDITVGALARKVEQDVAITAKVLRLSNSSYYGVMRTIKTVDDAIAILGLSKLQTLVIASGVTGSVINVPGLNLQKFWRHSLVNASVSRELARVFEKDADVAYVSGLLHNVGVLLLHMVFPQAAADVDSFCHGASVEERQGVEHTTIGLDHCQVGEELARRWNFPQEITRVLRYYATPLNKEACDLAPIIYMAAHIAFCLEHGEEAKHIAETLNIEVAKVLGVDRIEWIDRIESYRDLVKEAEALI